MCKFLMMTNKYTSVTSTSQRVYAFFSVFLHENNKPKDYQVLCIWNLHTVKLI